MFLSMSEKWKNSSIFTKIATFTMALCAIMSLVWNLIVMANVGATGSAVIQMIILFAVYLLLAFGLYKVVGVAKVLIIIYGIFAVLFVIGMIAVYNVMIDMMNNAMNQADVGGILALVVQIAIALIPDELKRQLATLIILMMSPYVLVVITMLCLFFTGKDFKKVKAAK